MPQGRVRRRTLLDALERAARRQVARNPGALGGPHGGATAPPSRTPYMNEGRPVDAMRQPFANEGRRRRSRLFRV